MTDSRKVLDYEGIGAEFVTMKADGTSIVYDSTQPGGAATINLAVTVSADQTVALTQDGNHIFGKLILVEADGFCTVQYDGMCKLPAGTAATCTAGKKQVGALGPTSAHGYVRDQASTAENADSNARCVDASGSASNGPVYVNLG